MSWHTVCSAHIIRVFSLSIEKAKTNVFHNIATSSSFDELEFVAKFIRYKIHEGARFKDFSLALADEGYIKPLQRMFERYDIPLYLDHTMSLSEVAYTKFFVKCLEISEAGFTKTDLEYLVFSPFLKIVKAGLFKLFFDWSKSTTSFFNKRQLKKTPSEVGIAMRPRSRTSNCSFG